MFNNKMKGSKTMDIIFAVLVFVSVNIFFLWLIGKTEEQYSLYETMFCCNVRTELGRLAYTSKLEAKRENLNRKSSKF